MHPNIERAIKEITCVVLAAKKSILEITSQVRCFMKITIDQRARIYIEFQKAGYGSMSIC